MKTKMMIRQTAAAGAWLFQQMEIINRYISFIAAYELAKESRGGKSTAGLYEIARDGVETTQFEYAKWNRPEFMRGKMQSAVFLFYQYVQNILFFAFGGDPGWWRWWLIMLVAGGISGLPFADNLMDFATFALRKFGDRAKWDNPETDVRLALRRTIRELDVNPDLIMHGISRYSFGIPQVTAGASPGWAGFDLSGSLSLGRIIPGTEALASTKEGAEKILDITSDISGAFFSIPISIMQAAVDTNPDAVARWSRAMPSALRGPVRAVRTAQQGELQDRAGARVVRVDPSDPAHFAELVGQSLGFRPTRWAIEQDKSWAITQSIMYWETRRRALLETADYARRNGDEELWQEAVARVQKFNSARPKGVPAILSRDLRQSLRTRAKGRVRKEAIGTRKKRYYGVAEEVRDLFPREPGSTPEGGGR